MDRSLDDVISERQRPAPRGRSRGAFAAGSRLRDSYRKPRDDQRDPDDDHWVHDRFEGDRLPNREPRDREYRSRRNDRDDRSDRIDRYEPSDRHVFPSRWKPELELMINSRDSSAKLRVENLHYDLTERDLNELFTRKGPISQVELLYDRAGRSQGVAYVTYVSARDADRAIREFDGAKALDQTIRLTLVPTGPSAGGKGRGAGSGARTDAPVGRDAGRSLFDRIDSRRRSRSPGRTSAKPAPDDVDRYVPRDSRLRRQSSRSRSPVRARRERGGRERRGGSRKDAQGRPLVGGRPRLTANELDAEMDDYWGGGSKASNGGTQPSSEAVQGAAATVQPADEDIDMIE